MHFTEVWFKPGFFFFNLLHKNKKGAKIYWSDIGLIEAAQFGYKICLSMLDIKTVTAFALKTEVDELILIKIFQLINKLKKIYRLTLFFNREMETSLKQV